MSVRPPPDPPVAVVRRVLEPRARLSLLRRGIALPTLYLYGPRGRLRLRLRGDDRDTLPTLLRALNAASPGAPLRGRWPRLANLWKASRGRASAPSRGRFVVVLDYAGWDPACRHLRADLVRAFGRLPRSSRPRIVLLTIPFSPPSHRPGGHSP